MKIHDLKPAPGLEDSRGAASAAASRGKGGKTAGRGTKGQGARGNVSPRFEGGQTPLHRRTPKAKGFNNPFRVEYHVVNLDTLDGFDAGTEVDPGHAARARPRGQAGPGQDARPGASSPKALTVRAHGFSQARGPGDRGRRRHDRGHPGAVGRRPSAGPRERPDQPVSCSSDSRSDRRSSAPMLLPPAEHVPGARPAEQDPLHDLDHRRSTALGAHLPVPYVDF